MADQLEFRWDDPGRGLQRQDASSSSLDAKAPAAIMQAAEALRLELEAKSGLRIHLRITNNSRTMMSARHVRAQNVARVGLHRMFLQASGAVRDALAKWIANPRVKRSGKVLDEFIRDNNHLIEPAPPRQEPFRTQGDVHDLQYLFDDLNARFFDGAITARITWGRMPVVGRRRSIRLGSYWPVENVVRIHPLLDQDFVPPFFVRYIIFHEMLHAHLGIEECGHRRVIHPPRFKRAEQAYPDYGRAIAWLENRRNLARLLNNRRISF